MQKLRQGGWINSARWQKRGQNKSFGLHNPLKNPTKTAVKLPSVNKLTFFTADPATLPSPFAAHPKNSFEPLSP
ncbi:hypothetical protein Pfra02_43270 [Pseudomonas fragi]|nr:hypothetical protein Pfra02_43270 [Pseudomonas fragi]